MENTFYKLRATTLQGKEIGMETYAGKMILVVNTASKCGLTPQLEGLEKLYQKYKNKGLVILGFPCNQFAGQEPGNQDAIAQVCFVNYGVSFQMFSKIEVNGAGTHPIYKYLKNNLKGLFGGRIMWNFTKFLISPEGKPLKRFSPTTSPAKIDSYLEKIMK